MDIITYGLLNKKIKQKADLDSPHFTGEPTAPTPDYPDNSERLATTEYVNAGNCVVWVMNGDDAAQSGRDITANYWNGTNLNVRFRTTTNAGAYRFNYLIAFWG